MNNTLKNLILPGSRLISPLLVLTCGGLEEAWLMANFLAAEKESEGWIPNLYTSVRRWYLVPFAHPLKALQTRWLVEVDKVKGNQKKEKNSLKVRVLRFNLEYSLRWYIDPELEEAFPTPLDYLTYLSENPDPDNLNVWLEDVDKVRVMGDKRFKSPVNESLTDVNELKGKSKGKGKSEPKDLTSQPSLLLSSSPSYLTPTSLAHKPINTEPLGESVNRFVPPPPVREL